jgi:hypothetical protein
MVSLRLSESAFIVLEPGEMRQIQEGKTISINFQSLFGKYANIQKLALDYCPDPEWLAAEMSRDLSVDNLIVKLTEGRTRTPIDRSGTRYHPIIRVNREDKVGDA